MALLTDFNVRTEPALPTMGPRGSKIVDPVFGTTILRVSDAADDGTGVQASYSTYPVMNVNNTRLYGVRNAAGQLARFWQFNAATFTASNPTNMSGVPPVVQYFMLWSGTNPDMLWVTAHPAQGAQAAKLYTYNVATNTATLIKDFSGLTLAGIAPNSGAWLDQHQHDLSDNIFSFTVKNSGGTPVGFMVWKRDTDTVLLNVTNAGINETNVDKTGRYFSWMNSGCASTVYDLTTGPSITGTSLWCHNGQGTGTVFCNASGNAESIRSLAIPNTITSLMAGFFLNDNTRGQHHAFQATDESYGLVSTYRVNPGNQGVTAAFDAEMVLVATSGNAVKRIAHHRSIVVAGNDIPAATISKDGQFVAFTSNWGGAGGLNRRDLYLVQLPATVDTTPPAAPTGLTIS